jgi:hypothetical protein
MKALLVALMASASVFAGFQIAETVAPQVSESAAYIQGRLIADRAFLESEMGEGWEESLAVAVESTRNNEGQLTLSGTTVVWDSGIDTWCIALPEPNSLVKPVRCA